MNKEPEDRRQESKLLGVCSWEGVEAEPGLSECEDSSSHVGRELMGPLLGNSPETPAYWVAQLGARSMHL